jgi:hypothetical protein
VREFSDDSTSPKFGGEHRRNGRRETESHMKSKIVRIELSDPRIEKLIELPGE